MMSHEGLSNEQLQRYAPSAFANTPWHQVSDKYTMVPTLTVIERLRAEGFVPVSARQGGTRIEGKENFTKHMIRFRRAGERPVVGDIYPEIMLVNSHDRTSSYQLSAAMMRLACLNGMACVTSSGGSINIRHSGDIVSDVMDATYRIIEDFPELSDQVQRWNGKTLTTGQEEAYAKAAIALRWEGDSSPGPERLLRPRRAADAQSRPTLLGAYNRVQEALIRGGTPYVSVDESGYRTRKRSRAVTGIDQDIKLNRALWVLTEEMAKMVA